MTDTGNEKKQRFTIYLDNETHRVLEEFVFVQGIRTRNTAVTEIVTEYLAYWHENISPLGRK